MKTEMRKYKPQYRHKSRQTQAEALTLNILVMAAATQEQARRVVPRSLLQVLFALTDLVALAGKTEKLRRQKIFKAMMNDPIPRQVLRLHQSLFLEVQKVTERNRLLPR